MHLGWRGLFVSSGVIGLVWAVLWCFFYRSPQVHGSINQEELDLIAEGLYGWGESGLSGRELAMVGAVEHYRKFLVGKNPSNIGALWQEMYRSLYFEGGRVLTAAISAIGEEFASKWDFMPYLENDLTNFARVDVCNVGCLTESMKVAAMAEAHYIDLMPHDPLGPICTAATIHLAAAVPNFAWLEVPPYDTDTSGQHKYFENHPEVKDTIYQISDAPGLGMNVNEETVKAQSFKFWEAPRLHKADGSFTNR